MLEQRLPTLTLWTADFYTVELWSAELPSAGGADFNNTGPWDLSPRIAVLEFRPGRPVDFYFIISWLVSLRLTSIIY